MNAIAATEDNIQDQNLVNDQITAAIDKLSETAVKTEAPAPDPTPAPAVAAPIQDVGPSEDAQGATQAAPSILEEHEEASSDPSEDENSIGSINLGSVPAETADHTEPASDEQTDQAVPPPAISDSDITNSLPAVDEPQDEPQDEAPAAPDDSPIAAPIAITTESAAEESVSESASAATIDVKETSSDMDYLKSRALIELAPIVDNLDVSQEQMYHTVIDAYDATKDGELLQQAFDFASGIPDDKIKAQALQKIIDRIN